MAFYHQSYTPIYPKTLFESLSPLAYDVLHSLVAIILSHTILAKIPDSRHYVLLSSRYRRTPKVGQEKTLCGGILGPLCLSEA